MKIITWYVERCKAVKGFNLKTSLVVGLIGAVIFTLLNKSIGYPLNEAILMGIIVGAFVCLMWSLFMRQTIKFRDKVRLRDREEEDRIKEEKRERARQNAVKKNNKKKNKR